MNDSLDKFSKNYFELLNGEYKGINLTRISTYDDFLSKQIKDSLAPLYQSSLFKAKLDETKKMVDIGFGGGFPILPMAFLNEEKKFVGVETRGKKARVVAEMAEKLGLNNVSLKHERIENILIDLKCVCTLKAVGKVGDFLNKFNTTEKIQVYFYKGPNFYILEKDQIEEVKKDWNIIEELELDVPGTDKRYLIGFENKKVLHGTENKLNNLVKLSDII